MRYQTILNEALNAQHVLMIKKMLIDGMRVEYAQTTRDLLDGLKKNREFYLDEYMWPQSESSIFTVYSILYRFRSAVLGALQEVVNSNRIKTAFGITKNIVVRESSEHDRGNASLELTQMVMKYSTMDARAINMAVLGPIVKRMEPLTMKTNLNAWGKRFSAIIEGSLMRLDENEDVKMLCNVIIHELTHASQEAGYKDGYDKNPKNAYGVKFKDYYHEIARGLSYDNYHAAYHEIDAYANGSAAEIIQKNPNLSDLKTEMANYAHPVYKKFKPTKNMPAEKRKIYMDIWGRFQKTLMKNLQQYIEAKKKEDAENATRRRQNMNMKQQGDLFDQNPN